jgi:prepilin-type N-terminal cleavage/methylation domain-containing protein
MKAKLRLGNLTKQGKSGAFTLVEVLIVVGIIALLISIAVPYFVTYRATSQTKACVENLRVIEAAKQIWALEEKKAPSADCDMTSLVGPTLYIKTTPYCPAGGGADYIVGKVSEVAACPKEAELTQHVLIP